MTEADTRARIVAEALTWLATPYHHRARVKGAGVDCAQLPIAVYSDLGLIDPVDPAYVRDWHLHRGEEVYLDFVTRWATEIGSRPAPGQLIGLPPLPGDFVLWRWGRTYSHGAIVVDGSRVVHSYVGVGVTLDDMNQHEELRTRPARFFSLWP